MPTTPVQAACVDPHRLTFDPERALPAAAYRDAAWFRAEMDRVWHGDWVFASTEAALATAGDQVPVMIGDQPVLLLRNRRGELVALSNLCRHRGTLLVERPANARRIQCPYHAWTYDHAGRLLAVPHAPSDAVDKSAHCLPAFRVDSWFGLVFVSLNPDVEPLAERFAAIEPHVSARGIGALSHQPNLQSSESWECNWKVAILNAMESYHLFKVHPRTLEPYTPTKDAYYITGSARATATGGVYRGQDDYLLVSLPPGFVGVFTRNLFVWQAVHPDGTQRCAVRTGGAFGSRQRTASAGRFGKWFTRVFGAAYASADFLREDKAICERVQRGIKGEFDPGRLLPIERVVADFGHYLDWRLNEVEPPPVHAEPAP